MDVVCSLYLDMSRWRYTHGQCFPPIGLPDGRQDSVVLLFLGFGVVCARQAVLAAKHPQERLARHQFPSCLIASLSVVFIAPPINPYQLDRVTAWEQGLSMTPQG
jgi:hypothetical protein